MASFTETDPMTRSVQPQRANRMKLALAIALCVPAVVAVAQHAKPAASPAPQRLGASAAPEIAAPSTVAATASTKPAERLREGTRLIDVVGTFQNVGDRIIFTLDSNKESYRVLENLALQRIALAL